MNVPSGNVSSGPPSLSIDYAKWLKKFGSWNAKRTRATTSIFDIPINLLCDVSGEDDQASAAEVPSLLRGDEDREDRGRTCRACNLTFLQQTEQQQHFKTELHRINLKRNLTGLPPLVDTSGHDGGDEGPVKGVRFADEREKDTADSSSDEEEEIDQIYSAADYFDDDSGGELSAGRAPSEYVTGQGAARKHLSKQEGPQYVFSSAREALSMWDFSVSVGALGASGSAFEVQPWSLLSRAIETAQDKNGSMWCVIILRSGRFAGAVFEGQTVLMHKVLRRYTVRAKAGGSQSSHDGQGKNAKSVGAMLRRYGEQALTEDVRALLREWAALIQSCSAVFLSVPKTMRGVVFEDGGKDVPVRRDDPRVRLVPFMVKKPTFEEVRGVHARLSTVTFQPRGSFDPSHPYIDATTSSSGRPISDSSSGSRGGQDLDHGLTDGMSAAQSVPTAPKGPELPHCAASVLLFGACASGDVDRVREILARIRGDDPSIRGDDPSIMGDDPSIRGDDAGVRGDEEPLSLVLSDGGNSNISSNSKSNSDSNSGSNSNNGNNSNSSNNDNDSSSSSLIAQQGTEELGGWDMRDVLDMPSSLDTLATCLHVASELGHGSIVQLLLAAGADPTRVDIRGRPPYFLAKTKDARDAFRRARATTEDLFAWDAAGVPAALTDEMERQQREKEKEKKKRSKAKKKEADERDREDARRAEAAREEQKEEKTEEARRRRTAAGQCAQCSKSLYGVKALDVFDRRCCSSSCVLLLRRQLAAEAAEKRFA